MVPLDLVQPHLCLSLSPEDALVLANADAGDADAQNEVALLFLTEGKPEWAMGWLELAAKHGHADAMNLLGTGYIEGNGVPKNENLGIAWIAKAAANGHVISQRQMDFFRSRPETPKDHSST